MFRYTCLISDKPTLSVTAVQVYHMNVWNSLDRSEWSHTYSINCVMCDCSIYRILHVKYLNLSNNTLLCFSSEPGSPSTPTKIKVKHYTPLSSPTTAEPSTISSPQDKSMYHLSYDIIFWFCTNSLGSHMTCFKITISCIRPKLFFNTFII